MQNMNDFELTVDAPYLTLKGVIWSVYDDYLRENGPCYNETVLW